MSVTPLEGSYCSSWKPTYVIKLDAQRWNSNRLTFRPLLDLEIDSFFFPFYFLQVSSPPCGPLRVGVAQMTTVSANSICTCTSVSRRHDVLWFGKKSRFPLLCSFSLQFIFFQNSRFYGNYSTSDSHTDTILSHAFAYSSISWRRKPSRGLWSV